MTASDRLRDWLSAAQISQAEMARRCGYDRHNFHNLLKNRFKPSLRLASAIERETGGAIPASAWTETEAQVRSAMASYRAPEKAA